MDYGLGDIDVQMEGEKTMGRRKPKETDDCTLYAGVRASIQSAYAPEIAILLFAVDRYAPLHHH